MKIRTLVSVWIGLAAPNTVGAQLSPDTAQRVDDVFAAINRTDSPGCVLGINRDGQPLYRHGYGMASLEFTAPMTEFSVLESGSVAKQFTAGTIVELALAGKLDLDDPVRKYLPELADYGAPITLRMLLNHTSGIRDMWTLFGLAGNEPGTVLFSMEQALQMVYRQRELNFPPNTQYLYSNSGYLLLTEVIRRVSGHPLNERARDMFFRPLGMRQTQWRSDWNQVVPGRATAYAPKDGGWRVDMPFMNVYGAGGLLTTVGDLLIWNDHLSAPRLVSRAWTDSLERRGRLRSGQQLSYALGLQIGAYRGEREVSHTGATGGYRTYLARFPERRTSVAVLCNFGSADPAGLGHQALDQLIGRSPDLATPAPGAPAAGPIANATDFVGLFRDPESESMIEFSVVDGRLHTDLDAGVALTQTGPDQFRFGSAPLRMVFQRNAKGTVPSVKVTSGDDGVVQYQRVSHVMTTAEELSKLVGTYYSDELDATYRIQAQDTTLLLGIPGQPDAKLVRTAALSFSNRQGVSVRFVHSPPDGFLLFAGRVRNLHFAKK